MSRSRIVASWAGVFVLALTLHLPAHSAPQSVQTLDGAWSSLSADAAHPSDRREYAAVYDFQRNRYIIFGGFGFGAPDPGGLFLEVWALSLGGPDPAWDQLTIAGPSPGERANTQWGYDPARQRLLIFGGYGHHYPGGPDEYLNDVWELSLDGTPAWTELHPTGTAPEGRLAGASVYDPLRQRFVGFGGTRGLPVDTWVLDLSGEPAWVSDSLGGTSPPGSYGMTAIYDIFRDRMLTFGGSTSDAYYGCHNDLWELSLSSPLTWTKLDPIGPLPAPRRTLTSVHDLIRDRMVIFGGWDGLSNDTTSFLGDTWALALTPELRWTQLSPAGSLPVGRDAMGAVYDPLRDRMVVFGGWAGDHMLGDTWFLDWGLSAPDPTMAATAQATSQVATISWGVQNVIGERAAVFRREVGTPWSSIATVENAGTGTLSYQDHSVTPGVRYGYLIAVPSQRGAVVGGETWVDVPVTTSVPPSEPVSFALAPVRPNPVVGRLLVSLSLAGGAPARLDLLDVAGRRQASRAIDGGNGPQTVDLGGAGGFAPGVYFLRLTQAGRMLTLGVVISGRESRRARGACAAARGRGADGSAGAGPPRASAASPAAGAGQGARAALRRGPASRFPTAARRARRAQPSPIWPAPGVASSSATSFRSWGRPALRFMAMRSARETNVASIPAATSNRSASA